MQKLKEAYSIKKDLIVNSDINELGTILKNNSNINTININPDNTIYVESNSGLDSIKETLELGVMQWVNRKISVPIGMIYNTLPITSNACILKI